MDGGATRASSLERYRHWRQLLDDGVYPTRAALARAEEGSRAAVPLGLGRLAALERARAAAPGGTGSTGEL